jgi:hypothetical protein
MNREQILQLIEDLSAQQLFEFILKRNVTLEELKNTGNLEPSKRKNIEMLIDEKRAQILAQIEDLSAEQLFEYITQQIVTLDELKETGELDVIKRKEILALQNDFDKQDDTDWERLKDNKAGCEEYISKYPFGKHSKEAEEKIKNFGQEKEKNDWEDLKYTELGCSDYITKYPNGLYVQEAKDKINHFEQLRLQANAERNDILQKLRENTNHFTPGEILKHLNNNVISYQDILDAGVPSAILQRLYNIEVRELKLGNPVDDIPTDFTEVYFWGIPGSGKTTALSAILSTAENKGYLSLASGPGLNYATQLKNVFNETESVLPPPTPVEKTQFLPFSLRKGDDHPRTVSLIELSGEIFECFYNHNAGTDFPTNNHQQTFNSLMHYLNSPNRKIHFFFIDYNKGNAMDINNRTQSDYLNAAAEFFEKNSIFKKSTDAVYVVLTKADLIQGTNSYEERRDIAGEFLNDRFPAFIRTLKAHCKKYSINSGRVIFEPFSLGKVYFKFLCSFDDSSAKKILDILFERIRENKPDKIGSWFRR